LEIYMSQNQPGSEVRHFDLPQVASALRNEKALFALLVTGLLAGSLVFLGAALADPTSTSNSFLVAGLFVFLALLVFPTGGSVAGLLLMDQARGQEPRPMRFALIDGIAAALRIFSVSLIGIAVVAAFYLFLGLLLFLCKLPIVGPALFAVLFPILIVLAGLLFFSLIVALSMTGPAIWCGATLAQALQLLWQVAVDRLMELLVNLFSLAKIVVLALFILASILLVGSLTIKGTSAFILGDALPDLSSMNPALFLDNEYAMAAIFGTMIGLVMILSALVAMAMMGLNLIYLRVTEGTLASGARNPIQPAAQQEPRLKQAATAPEDPWLKQEPAPPPSAGNAANGFPDVLASILATEVVPPVALETAVCPHCKALARPGDQFCGECGGKF
jgi:hypothetical protein